MTNYICLDVYRKETSLIKRMEEHKISIHAIIDENIEFVIIHKLVPSLKVKCEIHLGVFMSTHLDILEYFLISKYREALLELLKL